MNRIFKRTYVHVTNRDSARPPASSSRIERQPCRAEKRVLRRKNGRKAGPPAILVKRRRSHVEPPQRRGRLTQTGFGSAQAVRTRQGRNSDVDTTRPRP